ncbi:hypothetical protein BYT27DRAFT_7223736 [Phlegmacium glaucopus]|nr:hypothetical protein BYT27DRAFT_7223736 [Phlegmacium glaucopus]
MTEKKFDAYHPSRYDDPSAKLWSTYLSNSEKYDQRMAQNWMGDMDSVLIFAGLFSASLTAFITQSYQSLNPNSSDDTVFLLAQISEQLAALSNSTSPSGLTSRIMANYKPVFSPSTSAIVCNILWFLSLGFSLACALSATLVEQWTRHYIQACNSKPAPQDRARISVYLFEGIKQYKMAAVVEAIPMLLHISVFLFFIGLVAFLVPVNPAIQYLMLGMLLFCGCLYFLITILPIFHLACPFRTPLSSVFWRLLQQTPLYLYRRGPREKAFPATPSMEEARELYAMDITAERDERDFKAMCWTLNALREDNELEPFIEVIPSVVSGHDYSAKLLLDNLLNHHEVTIKLGYRLPRLLATCIGGLLDPSIAQKRAITCLKAMWSLTMLSMPKAQHIQATSSRQNLKFKEDALALLHNVEKAIPLAEGYISSASIVVARSLMDMQIERAAAMEERVLEICQNLISSPSIPSQDKTSFSCERQNISDALHHRLHILHKEIFGFKNKRLTTPLPHIMIEAVAAQQTRLMTTAASSTGNDSVDVESLQKLLHSLKEFQLILNQAGFSLALEYTARILTSDQLPHEAFNTLRRTFFRLNFNLPFTKGSQERLVTCLEEAAEQSSRGSTRLPHNIVDILLGMTRALKDPLCIMKARGIITSYMKFAPDAAAPQALSALEKILPRDPQVCSPLDLFSSHLYTDARPSRSLKRSRTGSLSAPYTVWVMTKLVRARETIKYSSSITHPACRSREERNQF